MTPERVIRLCENPDETLADIRHLIGMFQQGLDEQGSAFLIVERLVELDRHITSGGRPPADWERGYFEQQAILWREQT